MQYRSKTTSACAATSALFLATSLVVAPATANARVRHHAHGPVANTPAPQTREGVVGYFGPGAYGPYGSRPFGYGYGYGYGYPRGDLGFALLGALNGGGFRGFVECGNYYASTPGACGF